MIGTSKNLSLLLNSLIERQLGTRARAERTTATRRVLVIRLAKSTNTAKLN